MSFQSNNIQNENRGGDILSKILHKFSENRDTYFLKIAQHHVSVCDKYLRKIEEKGKAAFPNRLEYQKFQAAQLFLEKLNLFEFSSDSSLKEFKKYKDMRSPPLDAFHMTSDLKDSRKTKFCHKIDKGDVLHLKVVEESDNEYKLLVINKYNENERVIDYCIHAYLMKTYLLNKLPRPLKISDLIRAAVLGKLKMEENVFSKLLVTLNNSLVNEKYKDVRLGLVFESEIPFYPEDISKHHSFISYLKTEKSDDPQEMISCMTSLGIDPYKTYSFYEPSDGGKPGVPKAIDYSTMELKAMEKSMNLVKEAEKQFTEDADADSVLAKIEKALEIYPLNDVAYAVRGQLYKTLCISENNGKFLKNALNDFDKSLEINSYNLIATREYLSILQWSVDRYKNAGDKTKAEAIMNIIHQYKHVGDLPKIMSSIEEERNREQSSSIAETEGPMVY